MTTTAPPKPKFHPFSADETQAAELGVCWHPKSGPRACERSEPAPAKVGPSILCPAGHRHLLPVIDGSCWLDADAVRDVQVTMREHDVATELLRTGASNHEIGRKLYLCEDTVKTHMKSLLRRTGAGSRAELMVAVFRGRVRLIPTALVRNVYWGASKNTILEETR